MSTTYDVRRSLAGADDWTVVATDLSVTALRDSELTVDTAYDYQVRACNIAGCSAWSASVTVTPIDIRYDVRRSLAGQNNWTVIATDLTDTAYLAEGLLSNTAYDFQVRACYLGACSDWSTVATETTHEATGEPVDIAAETILELATGLTLETPTEIAATTLLELVADLSLDTRVVTNISATTLLELVADLDISTSPSTLITAETLLELVAETAIQQEHRIRAETLLEIVADLSLQADDAATISATTLLELVATAETATAHHVRPEALLQLVATTAVAQDHLVRAAALLQLVAHEGYTGPGTGIVVPGARFSPNTLREGDTFRVVLPWAGINGMTGLAHVNSRTLRDDRHEQDVDLHIEPLDRPNIPALAGGARPVAGADQQDYARKQARQGREIDRIERDRNR